MVTIAVFGHTGLLGKPLTAALAETTATVKVLYRAGSDVSQLPAGVETTEISYDDEAGLTKALSGVDIVVPLQGGPAITVQKKIIPAAKAAGVKLFVPSEYGVAWTAEDGAGVPLVEAKHEVEHEIQKADIPYVKINTGGFANLFLGQPFFGVDVKNNKLDVSGESLDVPAGISSIEYIGAAVAAILTTSSPSSLAGRTLGIYEVKATAGDIAAALKAKHGKEPEITYTPVDKLKANFQASTDPLHRLVGGVRLKWAAGTTDAGNEEWDGEVKGYTKKPLAELF